MSLPREQGLPGHAVAKQIRRVYGTRDAGALGEDCYREALESMGFKSGVASACIFHQADRDLTVVVHGDDFRCLSKDTNVDWYEAELAKHFDLKLRGRLGVGCSGDNRIRILNRIVRVTERGLEYEADPRHVDPIAESLEITKAKPAASPGIKNPDDSTECEFKENETQCDRTAVIDPGLSPDSSVSSSATMQGGAIAGLEPKNNDTIASLDVTKSVGDKTDAETAGTDHNNDAETDGTTCNGAEN